MEVPGTHRGNACTADGGALRQDVQAIGKGGELGNRAAAGSRLGVAQEGQHAQTIGRFFK
jgi:hypothetical protein